MIENITIIDNNGNSIIAEGISYISINHINKKYILYTMNEIVSNNLTKIYVAEVGDSIGVAQSINDSEWEYLKMQMSKISAGEDVPEIVNLPMSGLSFNVGKPKKIAIEANVKQAFKDRQVSKTLEMKQNANTMVVSEPTGNQFFSADSSTSNEVSNPVNQQNIFDNPIKPLEYTQSNEKNVSIPSAELKNESVNSTSPTIEVGDSNQIINTNALSENLLLESEKVETTPETRLDSLEPEIPLDSSEEIVTKEEALAALELLNKYFKYTKELPSSLVETKVANQMNDSLDNKVQFEEIGINYKNEEISGKTSIVEEPAVNFEIPVNEIIPNQSAIEQNSIATNNNIMQIPDINQIPNIDIPQVPTTVDNSQNIAGNGYVANGSGASVQIVPTQQDVLAGIPVIMPDGYEESKNINSMNGMGPSSLPVDGVPTLGLKDVA